LGGLFCIILLMILSSSYPAGGKTGLEHLQVHVFRNCGRFGNFFGFRDGVLFVVAQFFQLFKAPGGGFPVSHNSVLVNLVAQGLEFLRDL